MTSHMTARPARDRAGFAVLLFSALIVLAWGALWSFGETFQRSDTIRSLALLHLPIAVALIACAFVPGDITDVVGALAAGAYCGVAVGSLTYELPFAAFGFIALAAILRRVAPQRRSGLIAIFVAGWIVVLPFGGPQGPDSGGAGGG